MKRLEGLTDDLYSNIRVWRASRDQATLARIGAISDEIKQLGYQPTYDKDTDAVVVQRTKGTNERV
jgi:hypothetical protein